MKATIVLTLLLFGSSDVLSLEVDPNHDRTVREIGEIKTRVKGLREITERLNRNVCRSGSTFTSQCSIFDDLRTSFKCITIPANAPLIKKSTLNYAKPYEAPPVVAVGFGGFGLAFGGDAENTALDIQNNKFNLEVKSDDLLATYYVQTNFLSCPQKLNTAIGFGY